MAEPTPPVSPATDPERYRTAPGAIALRSRNVGPLRGERLIGYVPHGWSDVLGHNGAGKTRLVSALVALPLPKLGPDGLSRTDGESITSIAFGAASLTIEERESATGGKSKLHVDRRSVDSEGPITKLPDPIEVLVTGDHRVSDAAAWRARLEALVQFCPVAVTEDRLRVLAGSPLPSPDDDLADWLLARHQREPFGSMIDAADALAGSRGELNARAKRQEQSAEGLLHEASGIKGALRATLEAAARGLGIDTSDEVAMTQLEQQLANANGRADSGRLARAEASVRELQVAKQQAEDRRRQIMELRIQHGDRPGDELEAANAELALAESRLNAERAAYATATAGASAPPEVNPRIAEIKLAIQELEREARALAAEDQAAFIRRGKEASAALSRCRADVEQAERDRAAANTQRDVAIRRCNTWDEVAAVLARPLPESPSEDAIRQAEQELALARHADGVGTHAETWQRRALEHSRAQLSYDRMAEHAKALRSDVMAAWGRLGQAINDALPAQLIRIGADGEILVRHEDGERWYDVADDVRLSSGRLRVAMLELFLARTAPGSNVIVLEELALYIDDDNRKRLSAVAGARQIRLLAERPDANVTEPTLVWFPWEVKP